MHKKSTQIYRSMKECILVVGGRGADSKIGSTFFTKHHFNLG